MSRLNQASSTCAANAAVAIAAAAAWIPVAPGQVISTQSAATIPVGAFRASARMQYGLNAQSAYQLALLPGCRIYSPLSSAVISEGGSTLSAVPSFWNQDSGNSFRLRHVKVSNRLMLSIGAAGAPGGGIAMQATSIVNLTGANGILLDWISANASSLTIDSITSAGVTVPIGPVTWSDTALERSMLTGWDLSGDWTISGSVQLLNCGADAVPRLQADVITEGRALQLSAGCLGTMGLLDYGTFRTLTITDADFAQAQYGGTDGVIDAIIRSRSTVVFDVSGPAPATYSGGVRDLIDVPNVNPDAYGPASVTKTGRGSLALEGVTSVGGSVRIESGTVVFRKQGGMTAGSLFIGDADVRFEPDPVSAPRRTVSVSGALVLDPAASLESNLSLVPDASGAPGLLSCDRIAVAGAAVLGGDVRLVLDLRLCDEPLIPPPGETRRWVPIDCSAANSATGAPSSVTLRVIGEDGHPEDLVLAVNGSVVAAGARFDTIAGPAGLAVAVTRDVPACAGDLDGNGSIDGADLSTLLAAWGPAPTPRPEDLNADGQVDGADLTPLLAGWGACGVN